MACEEIDNPVDCATAGCTWYDNSCHTYPKAEFPWTTVIVGGIAAISMIAAAIYIKRH